MQVVLVQSFGFEGGDTWDVLVGEPQHRELEDCTLYRDIAVSILVNEDGVSFVYIVVVRLSEEQCKTDGSIRSAFLTLFYHARRKAIGAVASYAVRQLRI